MYCPRCGTRTIVIDTVHDKEHNTVMRKHKCKECANVFYSVEGLVPAKKRERFMSLWARNHRRTLFHNKWLEEHPKSKWLEEPTRNK